MQLELFDIRSNDAPQKGTAAVLAGSNVNKVAGGKTNTEKSTRDDFRSSLAMVSKENQDTPGDTATAALEPNQMPAGDDLSVLNDSLKEIIKKWPAGKRPALLAGAGGALRESKKSGSGAKESGRGTETRIGRDRVLSEAGKESQAMVRAWQGTAGFTSRLIKHLNSAQKPDSVQLGDENNMKAPAGAINLKAMPAEMAKLPKNSGDKETGTGFFKIATSLPAAKGSTPVKRVATRNSKENGLGSGKGPGEPIGQPANALKSSPKRAGTKAISFRSAGKNVATGIEKKAPLKIETKMTRAAAAGGNRLASDISPEKKAARQGLSNGEKVSDNPPESAAIAALSKKGPKDGATGLKPKIEYNLPVGDRNPGTSNAAGKQAESGSPVPFTASGSGQGQGLTPKSSRLQNASDRRGPEGLRNLTTADGEKSAAAVERKVLLSGDTNTGGKENSGTDNPAGQAARDLTGDLTRDLKGSEQPRFETTAAKMKLVENTPGTANGQPGPAVSATIESEKPHIDKALQARVLEQIGAKIRLSPQKGGHEIRINLRPETLGQVQLKVLTQDHSVTVKIVADTHVTREIIENNLGQLRADLNTLGLNVETLDVDVFTANDPGERDPAEHRGSFNRAGTGTGEHSEEGSDLTDRVRQMHAVEDAADGGRLIGVFA